MPGGLLLFFVPVVHVAPDSPIRSRRAPTWRRPVLRVQYPRL